MTRHYPESRDNDISNVYLGELLVQVKVVTGLGELLVRVQVVLGFRDLQVDSCHFQNLVRRFWARSTEHYRFL